VTPDDGPSPSPTSSVAGEHFYIQAQGVDGQIDHFYLKANDVDKIRIRVDVPTMERMELRRRIRQMCETILAYL
jgi:hypothetical protein